MSCPLYIHLTRGFRHKSRKSRIAIEYCYKYKDNHPKADVFWVHCGNKARFEAAYHEIARTLKVPGYEHSDCNPLQPLSDWLSDERNGSWLMILDNADDAEVWLGSTRKESTSPPLATFIPRGSHGSVLITTRDSQLGKHLTSTKDKPIDVLTLRPEDAEALLHSKLSEEGLTQEDAEEMTRVLDYLPLAITQAAAFLDQNDITVAQYLRLYRDGKTQTDELLEVGEYDTSRDHEIQNSVFHTWKLSFNQISKQAPLASNILSLMAMFDRQSISADLLRSKEETELDFIVAIRKLKAFSLIEEQPDVRCFSLHRLVQLSIQRWLNYKNELRRWQEIALTRLYDHYPEDEWFLNGAILETLNPHIHVILSCRFETVGANLKVARMKCILGSYARNQGHYASAFKYQSDSLSIRENYLGRHHPDTLISMNRLAAILLAQFKYDQAHGIYREVLEQRLKIFGPEHRETLHTMRGLGNAFYAQGNYLEAENLLKQTLEVQRKVFGAGDFTLALTMKTLSGVQSQLGYFSQAYDLQQKALQIYNETLGPQNPYTLSTMGLVAYLQTLQGDIYNGEKRLREVLEVQEATLGPLNRDTLASRLQLASVLSSRGKHEEAEQMARTVLKEQESVFGPEHPIALNTREQVALMLSTQGKYVEAEALAREGLSKRESSLGVNHVITLKALYNLTLVLRIAKHPDEALERRLVEEREKVLGFDHPDTLINVENLIDTLLLKGKFDAADQLMQRLPPRNRKNIEAAERQLVKAWEQKLGTDCPEALLSQRISGTETQGDIREVKLLKQMLERIRRVREYSTQHEEDNQVEGGTNHSVFHARSTAREDFARIQTVLSFRNSQLTQTWAGSR